MTLQLPISEAMALIKQSSGRDINLQIASPNTVKVGYTINVDIPVIGQVSKTVNLNVTVDKVQDKDVFLHCDTGMSGSNAILNMVLRAIPVLSKNKTLQRQDNGGLVVNLNEIDRLRDALNQIKINDLHFSKDNIEICFTPLP